MLRLLIEVAEQVINPRFRALADGQVLEKNPGDLVTVADREAEVLISERLADAYPDAVLLGEEAHAADPSLLQRYAVADHAFTIDPVDGTKNFVHGSPDHAVMVGETRGGQVVRGWIWQPQHELAYVAELGAGAWVSRATGAPHRMTRSQVPADDTGTVGPRGVTSRRSWIGRRLGDLPPLELTWVCCGVDYPKVVEGAADFVLYGNSHPWDHVPGSLLVAETGGVLSRLDATAYRPEDISAGPLLVSGDPATRDQVLPLLRAG